MHGMQCCPACWRGDATHVSSNDGLLCDCPKSPKFDEADLAAYDAARGRTTTDD